MASVYDYMASKMANNRDQQTAAKFDQLTQSAYSGYNQAKPKIESKTSAPWRKQDTKEDPEEQNLKQNLARTWDVNTQGMNDNRPETADEKKAREKRERNQMLISGIGTAIDSVAGMISGFPNENKQEDPVMTQIQKDKDERVARANRYYEFAKARNKALDDYYKNLNLLRKERAEEELKKAQTRYYEAHADKEEVDAADAHDVNMSQKGRNDRSGRGGKSGGGKSGGGKSNDEDYQISSHDGSRKFKFKNQAMLTNACDAAEPHVPRKEPYYKADRYGTLQPVGTAAQRVKAYAASEESKDNEKFWKVFENYSTTDATSGNAGGGSSGKTNAPWKRGKAGDGSGAGSDDASAGSQW